MSKEGVCSERVVCDGEAAVFAVGRGCWEVTGWRMKVC